MFNLKLLSEQRGMETGTFWNVHSGMETGAGTEEGPSKESVSWLNWENAEGRWVLCKLNCKASQDYLAPVF